MTQIKPERGSQEILSITQAKAKMFEYGVPLGSHFGISRERNPSNLFPLSIGLLGEVAAQINLNDKDLETITSLRESLLFSARFFDSYLESRLEENLNPYLLLLGSASYYLCNLPGSSKLLAKRLGEGPIHLECQGLENLLLWVLQSDDYKPIDIISSVSFKRYIQNIQENLHNFFADGSSSDHLFSICSEFRRYVYIQGTPRQLLVADVLCAVIRKKYENSTWHSLPKYSDLTIEQWSGVIKKKSFIRELWPAQHLLGIHNVFRGKSAVVQMPTSAGKTKATEIIIRSAFLSGRTLLAVIVAPFRALCHEIRDGLNKAFLNEDVSVDELSDVLQMDFIIERYLEGKQILVVTPEKFNYVLRHHADLGTKIGLLIYDEGHQFDSGKRGIIYELLLTSLKSMVQTNTQTILISAVISNADKVGKWLNGDNSEIVPGSNLIPTFRSIAFSSWVERLGQVIFVKNDVPDTRDFFVPRIIKQYSLQPKVRERTPRFFPERTEGKEGKEVALYLGLKLVNNGSVAIFCGTKLTAISLCERAVDIFERGVDFQKPSEFLKDKIELIRLHHQHELNFGENALISKCSKLGIFAHHNSTPHGIRLAVEYAIQQGHANFVVCTSTLAQGVNLPLRYLIITSIYQGEEQIKVRDFQNLIGRAGRAGMHTEGSIIFSDPVVYDEHETNEKGRRRWEKVKMLLDPSNSEPCASMLLSFLNPFFSDNGRYPIPIELSELVDVCIGNKENYYRFIKQKSEEYQSLGFSYEGFLHQMKIRLDVISSIESYLLANIENTRAEVDENEVTQLATGTLAYSLATNEQRPQLLLLFILLSRNIYQTVPNGEKRVIFGKTLYSLRQCIEILKWTSDSINQLVGCSDDNELLDTLWPILEANIETTSFQKCDNLEVMKRVAHQWINGDNFFSLFQTIQNCDVSMNAGSQKRNYKLEHMVDICENAFAFDGTLIVAAISEMLPLVGDENYENLILKLQNFQKRLKYGLPSLLSITLYELGFSDRVIAQELAGLLDTTEAEKREVQQQIKWKKEQFLTKLDDFPAYFSEVCKNLTS